MTKKKPPIRESYLAEINAITSILINAGYVDAQNYMTLQETGEESWTLNQAGVSLNLALKKRAYADIYLELAGASAFVLLMLDGAMVQFSYEGVSEEIVRHRLAYLPSPDLEPFQNDPELYINDVQFGDVIGRQVVPVPLRFDLDARPGVAKEGVHPVAHLTLGQYKHCRIPVSRAISPAEFMTFVIDNFYSTPDFPRASLRRLAPAPADTITSGERMSPHLLLP